MPGISARRQKAGKPTHSAQEPWWIEGADVECRHCSLGYAYEREVHCIECDAPMCPLCVTRIRNRILCPDCATDPGA